MLVVATCRAALKQAAVIPGSRKIMLSFDFGVGSWQTTRAGDSNRACVPACVGFRLDVPVRTVVHGLGIVFARAGREIRGAAIVRNEEVSVALKMYRYLEIACFTGAVAAVIRIRQSRVYCPKSTYFRCAIEPLLDEADLCNFGSLGIVDTDPL